MVKRINEIIAGLRGIFRFDNPFEMIASKYLFRRREMLLFKVQGIQILADEVGSDRHVIHDVFFDGMYDPFIVASAQGRERFHYLNLGGNIGVFDLRIQHLVSKPISGIAIEMNPSACARLIINLEINAIDSVKVVNAAAWNVEGKLEVPLLNRDTGQTCIDGGSGWEVPFFLWDHIFELSAKNLVLDLVKIDIEGAEEQVVPCISQEDAKKIRFIAIECHKKHRKEIVFSHLEEIGFVMLSDQVGDGETNLSLWKNKRLE